MKKPHKIYPKLSLIALCGQKNIQLAADIMKAKAYDYIGKNDSNIKKKFASLENMHSNCN